MHKFGNNEKLREGYFPNSPNVHRQTDKQTDSKNLGFLCVVDRLPIPKFRCPAPAETNPADAHARSSMSASLRFTYTTDSPCLSAAFFLMI